MRPKNPEWSQLLMEFASAPFKMHLTGTTRDQCLFNHREYSMCEYGACGGWMVPGWISAGRSDTSSGLMTQASSCSHTCHRSISFTLTLTLKKHTKPAMQIKQHVQKENTFAAHKKAHYHREPN